METLSIAALGESTAKLLAERILEGGMALRFWRCREGMEKPGTRRMPGPKFTSGTMNSRSLSAGCFEQEPNAALPLVDPVFQQTGSGNIAGIVAQCVYCAHTQDQPLLIFPEF
jgi:hypothetical protein